MSDQNIFENLNEEQYTELLDSLPLITILIAGADGQIDEQELNWAEKLTHIRTYADPEELNDFYAQIEENFIEKVQAKLNSLPSGVAERQEAIGKKLSGMNDILPVLENKIAFQIYESQTSFAEHIAKASGGFLRFGSISKAEKPWVSLPMIEPVILEEEESE